MKQVIINFFKNLFNIFSKSVDVVARPDLSFRNYQVLQTAKKEIGVKEIAGTKNNERVVKYHAYATVPNKKGQNDSVPWCSSFVCFVVENTLIDGKPMGSVNSMAARSWLNWGVSVKDDPMPGDIVVYWRGSKSGWQGHVGFWLGETQGANGKIFTLGGNQRDRVSVASYSKTKLLDIRRSSKHVELSSKQKASLHDFARSILLENGVDVGGKVT